MRRTSGTYAEVNAIVYSVWDGFLFVCFLNEALLQLIIRIL